MTCAEDGVSSCELHRRDSAGGKAAGWPVPLAGWCYTDNLAVARDGTAYVACTRDGATPRVVVQAFAPDGSVPAGWPVETAGTAATGTGIWQGLAIEAPGGHLAVAPDGTVHVGIVTNDERYFLHAYGPDGTRRDGWPRRLPGDAPEFAVAPDGTVVAWWYDWTDEDDIWPDAHRTWYTMLGPDGEALEGSWPVESIGSASPPVVGADGSIFYVSATHKVWGHDRRGERLAGWPYQLPDTAVPELRPDGNLQLFLQEWLICPGAADEGRPPDDPMACDPDRGQVIVLRPDGSVVPGWPWEIEAVLTGPVCSPPGYTYFPHVVAADGTLYVVPGGREVMAVDADGRDVPGWPYALPDGWVGVGLQMADDGRLRVTLADCRGTDGCCVDDATLTRSELAIDVSAVGAGATPAP